MCEFVLVWFVYSGGFFLIFLVGKIEVWFLVIFVSSVFVLYGRVLIFGLFTDFICLREFE